MLCWLLLHDFHAKDIQISKSDTFGSRISVYVLWHSNSEVPIKKTAAVVPPFVLHRTINTENSLPLRLRLLMSQTLCIATIRGPITLYIHV